VKTTDAMMRRFLTSASRFLDEGFSASIESDKLHLWEKSTLAGMCAYLLDALYKADPGEATIACSFIIDADENGEDLAGWVSEQLRVLAEAALVRGDNPGGGA